MRLGLIDEGRILQRLSRHWQQRTWLSFLLLPLACLYGCLMSLRNTLYRKRLLPSYALPAPLIIVGNITIGGTGKTPLVIWLTRHLRKQGYKPGIITRGYRASQHSPRMVLKNDRPERVGDEPVMLLHATNVPVVIGRDRVAAGRLLLAKTDCDILISDDGLQHLRLQRTLEICCLRGKPSLGNGFCLPSGPLREFPHRLNSVDLILHKSAIGDTTDIASTSDSHGYRLQGSLDRPIHICTRQALASFAELEGKRVVAIAGIAEPESFFAALAREFPAFTAMDFPDHHAYSKDELRLPAYEIVLMTSKDAVKCQHFADARFYEVPLKLEPERGFIIALDAKLLAKKTTTRPARQ